MEIPLMCRLCLVENVRMHAVIDKNMQEIYQRLTDTQFVTEDCRSTLACFFCYAKLKQCCQLQRKCLEAEERFAEMMTKDNPSIDRGRLELFDGLTKTPVENIDIVDDGQIAIKEEIPDVFEMTIEPKEEHQSNDLKLEDRKKCYSDEESTPKLHSELDLDIMDFKTETQEEQEVLEQERSDARSSSGSSGTKLVTRQFLYGKMQSHNLKTMDEKLTYLENYLFSSYGDTKENIKQLKRNMSYFKTALKKKWYKAQRKEADFLKSNQSWLNGTFQIPIQAQNRPDHPSKSFEESSERSKRRKTDLYFA